MVATLEMSFYFGLCCIISASRDSKAAFTDSPVVSLETFPLAEDAFVLVVQQERRMPVKVRSSFETRTSWHKYTIPIEHATRRQLHAGHP